MASFVDYQEDNGSAFKFGTVPVASVGSSELPNFTAAFKSDSCDDEQRTDGNTVYVPSRKNGITGIAMGFLLSLFLWVGAFASTYAALEIIG